MRRASLVRVCPGPTSSRIRSGSSSSVRSPSLKRTVSRRWSVQYEESVASPSVIQPPCRLEIHGITGSWRRIARSRLQTARGSDPSWPNGRRVRCPTGALPSEPAEFAFQRMDGRLGTGDHALSRSVDRRDREGVAEQGAHRGFPQRHR